MPTATIRDQLLDLGYCVVPGVLDLAMLAELRRVENKLLEQVDEAHRDQYRYQGCNIRLTFQDPTLALLYAYPRALGILSDLGFPDAKWASGYMLSKPPGGKPLYWHQDWAAWSHPLSARSEPLQLFLMYYLVDTTCENGCLRVIPRTHRKRIDLHSKLTTAHEGGAFHAPEDAPLFEDHPEAIDVCVRAGDVVIGDSRLLHAARANQSAHSRTVLTLWYYPDFDDLPEDLRARFACKDGLPTGFPDISSVLATYVGSAKPATHDRNPARHFPQETANEQK
ncbi:MAG: phytanoyl-CoA dioxygenase family protein [Planctomycetes bacterium]|nr:phytanoyl-CoA dioxygenase family protein [Planctomycetota bacterium]